jgi:transposase
MALSVTATVTKEVTLAPALKTRYLQALKSYAKLKTQREALDFAMKQHREQVEAVLAESGETSLALEGYKTTLIAPVRKQLDQKKLLALGVSMDIIQAATVEVATTPYIKITVPGGDDSN